MKNTCFIIFLFFVNYVYGQNNIRISSDFPGGNIVVNKTSEDTVWLKPDLSFIQGNWFYWYFKASNISLKRVTFKFEQNGVFAKYGPAYSINNNNTWKWYGENRIVNNSFSFPFSKQDTIAFFAVAIPYTEKNLYEFLSNLNNKELLKIDTLCLSERKRIIEKIIIPSSRNEPKFKVLLTARHHACEMMASYELEGIIESILNEKDLDFLRENVEFLIIPFIDKDGVEKGEQGKNRMPRDHNRDYIGKSVYNSTSVLREMVPVWSEGKLKIALDLHCPGLQEDLYMVGVTNPEIVKNQIIFSKLLEKHSFGEIKLYHKNFMPFGTSWNKENNYALGMIFDRWACTLSGISMVATLEFPYANASGVMVTKDGARAFGKAIAFSINEYLELLE